MRLLAAAVITVVLTGSSYVAAFNGSVVLFPYGLGESLTDCDDCNTKAIQVNLNPIYFDGASYNAYAVNSNGYITLYSSAREKVRGYAYAPDNLVTISGQPVISPLWIDVDLECKASPGGNIIHYEENNHPLLLSVAESIIANRLNTNNVAVDSMIIVTWDKVERYACPKDEQINTFQLLIATNGATNHTYLIFNYRTLQWIEADFAFSPPTVGYANGRGNGYQVELTNENALNALQGEGGIRAYQVNKDLSTTAATGVKGNKYAGRAVFNKYKM